MPSAEVQEFLDNLSEHDFAVGTEDLEGAHELLRKSTNDFTHVTEDTLAEAVEQNRT